MPNLTIQIESQTVRETLRGLQREVRPWRAELVSQLARQALTEAVSLTPKSLTVLLDEGDLAWTQRTNTLEIKDRGSIAAGHTRRGEEESVSLSFSAKWTQLLGKSHDSGDPLQLYEFLMFLSGAGIASTSEDGEQETLEFVFTVFDPAGVASENITFAKVYRESLTMSEAADYNLIRFSGRDFETTPTVERV